MTEEPISTLGQTSAIDFRILNVNVLAIARQYQEYLMQLEIDDPSPIFESKFCLLPLIGVGQAL